MSSSGGRGTAWGWRGAAVRGTQPAPRRSTATPCQPAGTGTSTGTSTSSDSDTPSKPTSTLTPVAAPSGFPLGTYSIVAFLDTVATGCTGNNATCCRRRQCNTFHFASRRRGSKTHHQLTHTTLVKFSPSQQQRYSVHFASPASQHSSETHFQHKLLQAESTNSTSTLLHPYTRIHTRTQTHTSTCT